MEAKQPCPAICRPSRAAWRREALVSRVKNIKQLGKNVFPHCLIFFPKRFRGLWENLGSCAGCLGLL